MDAVRFGLIVAAMVVTTFAQAAETGVEKTATVEDITVPNPNPASNERRAGEDTSLQTAPCSLTEIPPMVITEGQINKIRSELTDDRAAYIDRWLAVVAIFLTFFTIAGPIIGFLGFRRFQEIEDKAKDSAELAATHAENASNLVQEIQGKRDEAIGLVQKMTAESPTDDPKRTDQATESVLDNPQASPIDRAIVRALSLQREGHQEKAVEIWRGIASITEEIDNDMAARAQYSIGFLIGRKDPKAAIDSYSEAIRLKPDMVRAYNNRGVAKSSLRQDEAAISDYNEAIRLKPDATAAYINRGNAKSRLGFKDDARKDFETALALAHSARNASLAADVESSLRSLG